MLKQKRKVFPGLMCDGIEMFNDGTQLKVFRGGKLTSFKDLPVYYIEIIREAIAGSPDIELHLQAMHPDSEMKRIEQFAICNFSGLDYEPDVKGGVMQKGEYWDCPIRDLCPADGIVCTALEYNGHKILGREVQLIKLLTTALTNEAICQVMKLPAGSLETLRTKIYKKLGVQTKQEVAIIALSLNII